LRKIKLFTVRGAGMKSGRYTVLLALAMITFFMTGGQAAGEEIPIGKIDKIKGPVNVTRSDGREITASEGISIFAGDRIVTGKEGKVWFSFEGGRQFRLSEEAQVSVDELSGRDSEDSQPVLRLALGYLWSRIQKFTGGTRRTVLHTPTAVIGVRGTEFDSVVSLDGTSVVAVDEGSVEVEAEDEKAILDQGKMTQVDVGVKPSAPVRATPKEKRDWQAWRRERVKRLFKNLPQMAPKFRERFERGVGRFTGFTERVQASSARLRTAMEKVRKAKQERDRRKFRASVQWLKIQAKNFKIMAGKFRHGLNRVRVMGRLSHRIDKFVDGNKERFNAGELAVIESNLAVIARKRQDLRNVARQTVSGIRGTFRELKAFREEIRRGRS